LCADNDEDIRGPFKLEQLLCEAVARCCVRMTLRVQGITFWIET